MRRRTSRDRLADGGRIALLACAVLGATALRAEEPARAVTTNEAPAEDAAAEQARLEDAFRETLTGATLTGKWRTIRDGVLGEERGEKYTISSATKTAGDLWILVARVEYGDKDVTLPVPVRVRWAGDTPVISVTDAGLPGLGTYTARVVVYRDVYSGAWFGPGVTGTLSGTIRRDAQKDAQNDAQNDAEPSAQPAPDGAKKDDGKENESESEDENENENENDGAERQEAAAETSVREAA